MRWQPAKVPLPDSLPTLQYVVDLFIATASTFSQPPTMMVFLPAALSALLVFLAPVPALAFTHHAPSYPLNNPARSHTCCLSPLQMSTEAEVTATTTSSAEMAHAREVFSTFDTDGSGTIGSQELGDMLSALDIDASDEETAALFRYLDADGTGGVAFEQFQPWYSEAADAAKQSAEVFQGIIMSRRTVDSFDKTEVDQAVIKRAIECAIAAPNRRCTEPWHFIQLGPETVEKAAELKQELEGDEGSSFQSWSSIPGWMVVTYKKSPDGNTQAQREDFKAVCCAVQNFMLSLWSEGIGSKWTDGSLQQTKEFADLVGIDADAEKIAGIVWFGFAKGGLGEVKPKERRKGYDEVLDILP